MAEPRLLQGWRLCSSRPKVSSGSSSIVISRRSDRYVFRQAVWQS